MKNDTPMSSNQNLIKINQRECSKYNIYNFIR